MTTYEQSCNDFALFGSQQQEHNDYVENAAADYQHELWASEIASMANEGEYEAPDWKWFFTHDCQSDLPLDFDKVITVQDLSARLDLPLYY